MNQFKAFISDMLKRIPVSMDGYSLDVLAAFAAKVTGTGISFTFSFVLARLLGASGIGVYFLALTIITIGSAVARLGLDSAVLRFASVAYDQGDMPTLAALYKQCMRLVVVVGLVISLLIWLGIPYIQFNAALPGEFHRILSVMLFALVPAALILVQGEFFKSVRAPGIATVVQTTLLPVLLVIGATVLFLKNSATLNNIAFLYVVAVTMAVLIAGVIWRRRVPSLQQAQVFFDTRLLLRTSLPLLWVTSMHMVMSWTDILVLGFWSNSNTVGVYGVVVRVAALTAFIMMAVNSVIVPQFAALYAQGDRKALVRLAQRSTAWMLISALPVIMILLLFPQLVLRLFGEEFVGGDVLLRILVVGQLINITMGSVGYLLMMTGHERVLRNIVTVSAVLNLIGNILLIPEFGAVGAAISTAISLFFMTLFSYFQVVKKLKINTMGCLFRKTIHGSS